MNSLVDEGIIRALYEAAQSGVEIQLIVRGICCLRPGVEGVSENIRVTSIVGRFLEHSRIFYFENEGKPKIYLASADWMPRNLDRRVEVAFPVEDERVREEVKDIIRLTLADNVKARVMQPDGLYKRIDKRGKEQVHSQMLFYDMAYNKNKADTEEERDIFIPMTSPNAE